MSDPITRKDAEEALFNALCVVARCAAGEDGGICEKCESTDAILRQCRIIEPGGLDAETQKREREACCAEIQKVLTNYGHERLASKLMFRIMRGMHVEKGE